MIRSILGLLPPRMAVNLISECLLAVGRRLTPRDRLRFLFEVDNRLYGMEGKAAVAYEEGVHPKHRLINYRWFFANNLSKGDRVLDIGCGDGCMDHYLVHVIPNLRIVGIDSSTAQIAVARGKYGNHPNLSFKCGDAVGVCPTCSTTDVVILSNVLEHIEDRIDLLRKIASMAPKILIRVPCYDRDWRVPLKDEVGVDSRLDPTHKIEYTEKSFREELAVAGLRIAHMERRWGELYAVIQAVK